MSGGAGGASAMRTVFVVCEGQTEATFIGRVVAPAFYPLGISLVAQLILTSEGHKGGALSYGRVKEHLRNQLRNRNQPVVTTLIDLYKLDKNFPGFAQAAAQQSLTQRLDTLKTALHADVVAAAGCRHDHFIPYIQPYEFEALLFSDVAALPQMEPNWAGAVAALQAIRDAAGSPEHINDGPATKPAARLEGHLTNPTFRKRRHGPTAAEKITLAKIEAECAFFKAWLDSLRALAPPPPPLAPATP